MINLLPAVLIGGPLHRNNSMLFYNLTGALRERHILHHALRVCPAHEETGFPAYEQAHVRLLPINDAWNDELAGRFSQDLSQRLLPVLIDIGTDYQHIQTCILQHCTHLILLLHEHDQASKTAWFQLSERYGLLPLVHTYPSLESHISTPTAREPMIAGTFMSLAHGSLTHDPLFDCLVEDVASLFSSYSYEELLHMHLHQSPEEMVIHLPMLLHTIDPGVESWEPCMLPALFEYIPAHMPLSVYGQGPHWLYAALAAHADTDDFYQFDPCSLSGAVSPGWIASPPLLLNTTTSSEVHTIYTRGNESGKLTVKIPNVPLDYLQATSWPPLPFPPVPSHLGLILAGSMPTWLLTALVRLYIRAGVTWIACHQTQQCRAVVIFSQTEQHFVGEIITAL